MNIYINMYMYIYIYAYTYIFIYTYTYTHTYTYTCAYMCIQVMKRCTRCRTVLYCSRECQLKNWQAHKFLCGPNPQQSTQDTPVCKSPVFVFSMRNNLTTGNSGAVHCIITTRSCDLLTLDKCVE